MRRAILIAVATLTGLFSGTITRGQTTYTWTGLGGDSAFGNPANWQGNVAPAGLTTDNLVFPTLPPEQQSEFFVGALLNTPSSVGNLTFSGNYYSFYLSGTGPLTLHGNVAATSNVGNIAIPVILAPGNHIYSGSNYIFQTGNVSGTGGITVNSGTLALFGASNTYSGGTVVNGGTLIVNSNSALGSGSITLNGGALAGNSTPNLQLAKNFVLGSDVTFSAGMSSGNFYIGNGDGSDITPASGVTTVNLNLGISSQSVYLTGDMLDGGAPTTYTFSRDSISFNNHTFVLTGNNAYTGGTLVKSGGAVIFEDTWTVPATGLIAAEADGYAGLNNPVVQATLLSRLNPAGFAGIIGFGNGGIFTGPIDLANFTADSGTASLGTMDGATLSGLITPSGTSGQYRFQSSDTLFLDGTNPLSGANGVVSRSLPGGYPGVLVLRQDVANTCTGGTFADGASIVFDSAGSLSAATVVHLSNNGYVSVTDSSTLTLASLVARVAAGSVTNGGVIGVDKTLNVEGGFTNYAYTGPVDFSSLGSDVYLGTSAGHTVISGVISTANSNTGDYFLTAYGSSYLEVSSQLTGSKALHVGVAGGGFATVYLTNGANTYTGGTVLNAGNLIVVSAASLGPGAITVDPVEAGSPVGLEGPSNATLANNLVLNSGEIVLYWGSNSTFSGLVSGNGGMQVQSDLTLSGANTYAGGTSVNSGVQVTSATNTAFGTGSLAVYGGSSVVFASAAPQIGSLLVGETYSYNDDGFFEKSSSLTFATAGAATLTINQTEDGTFDGVVGQGSGVGSLVKNGSGTLLIGGFLGVDNAAHTPYTGGTTINAGTLIAGANNALGSGAITLNGGGIGTASGVSLSNPISFGANGGKLTGTGTIGTAITVGANAVISPGDSPGILTFGAGLTLAGGGSLDFEVQSALGPAGTGYDLINISSGLLDVTATAGSKFSLKVISLNAGGAPGNVSDFATTNSYSWLVFQSSSSGIVGFDPAKFALDLTAFTNGVGLGSFALVQGVNAGNAAIFLNFTPVPEPSAYALLALGLGLVPFAARRRHRR